MFRCLTLEGAREKAARYGGRGASYPWETGVSGREECEKWLRLITHQLHITADIAFAVQEYADITGDTRFYEEHAAEVLIETARFWMSRTRRNEDGSLSIPQAGGPDEFHVVCDDSAYILHMAAHNLRLADRAVCHLRRNAPEILARILETNGIAAMELDGFGDAANRLRAMRSATGLVEQCAGFFRLRDGIDGRDGGPRPFETQCVKQADVLMLPYLLPDQWDNAAIRVNFAYYEPRTVHGSSLSAGVHGILAARLGLRKVAEGYIHPLLGMDLDDARSDTAYGAHMAASGMNWSAIVRGYAGCRPRGDVFLIERSLLPPDWTRLTFRLLWRGADFEVDLRPGQVTVANREGAAPLPLDIAGERLRVMPGQVVTRGVAA
jgi:kojibiose phosphorylase